MLTEKGWKTVTNICNEDQINGILRLVAHENLSENQMFFQFSSKLNRNPLISSLVKTMKNEIQGYSEYSNIKLDKIWFVHTLNENSREGELPYVPHFDKRRYLKLMVYLSNVSDIDGPFTTASINVDQNEEKRLKLIKNAAEENLVEENLKYRKITLRAGDGIIFDTNCPHFASPVKKNGERKILRLDFQKMDWNDHLDSFQRRILKRIIS